MLHSSLFTAVILVVTLAHAAGAISHFFFFFFFGPCDGTVGHMAGLNPGKKPESRWFVRTPMVIICTNLQ